LNRIEQLSNLHRTQKVRCEVLLPVTQVRSVSEQGNGTLVEEGAPQKPNGQEKYRVMVGIGWPRRVGIQCEGAEDERNWKGGILVSVAGVIIIPRFLSDIQATSNSTVSKRLV